MKSAPGLLRLLQRQDWRVFTACKLELYRMDCVIRLVTIMAGP
jgi:hypothetical protein